MSLHRLLMFAAPLMTLATFIATVFVLAAGAGLPVTA